MQSKEAPTYGRKADGVQCLAIATGDVDLIAPLVAAAPPVVEVNLLFTPLIAKEVPQRDGNNAIVEKTILDNNNNNTHK